VNAVKSPRPTVSSITDALIFLFGQWQRELQLEQISKKRFSMRRRTPANLAVKST